MPKTHVEHAEKIKEEAT